MSKIKSVQGPKGHQILIPSDFSIENTSIDIHAVTKTIISPAFMIINNNEIYFIKLIDWNRNLMVRTFALGSAFVITDCIENPSIQFLVMLLKKGQLISFLQEVYKCP